MTSRAGGPGRDRVFGLPAAQAGWLGLGIFAAGISLIGSPYPDLARLQNLPTIAFLLAAGVALRRWPVRTSVVACVVLFLLLHTLGGRYAYSFVPYERWLADVGLPSPAAWLGSPRNHYDRLVHFSFGALLVHPITHVLTRHVAVRPKVALYLSIEIICAFSAIYEIFEWLLTLMMAGPDAAAYNGQQGDFWDAQKDMACAVIGAVVVSVGFFVRHCRADERLIT